MNRWKVVPGSRLVLADQPTHSTAGAPGNEKATREALLQLSSLLASYQEQLWAESRQSLLVVLQAMDTGGKDGTIRNVFTGVNPQGVHVTSFKAPSENERAHDFLWRIHRAAPRAGEIRVFNRSHYEDVLVARVKQLVPEAVWRRRYPLINAFEQQLAHGGTTVVKFFLHISRDEQARRLQARLDNPTKRWKFDPGDLTERKRWDEYQLAYQEAITNTSTAGAPWHVIPSDIKWYRNWAVACVLADTLGQMDPRYPPAPDIDPELHIV